MDDRWWGGDVEPRGRIDRVPLPRPRRESRPALEGRIARALPRPPRRSCAGSRARPRRRRAGQRHARATSPVPADPAAGAADGPNLRDRLRRRRSRGVCVHLRLEIAGRSELMAFVSRGFQGRRREDADASRVPPGQYVTGDFPVLSAGPTPHTPLDRWDFSIVGEVDKPRRWTWEEFRALPSEEVTVDIHCVTKWSKLDTVWQGVTVDTLLDGLETSAEYVVQFSDGGYTTNVPLEDVTDGKAWVV